MAFDIRERPDHDGVELVARPRLSRQGVVTFGAIALGLAGLIALVPGLGELGVMAMAVVLVLGVPIWAASGERTALELSARALRIGERRVRIEDITDVAEAQGVVRIAAAGRAFDIGQDWPADTRRWLVEKLEEARVQRAGQLEGVGPEPPPPAAIQALRGGLE